MLYAFSCDPGMLVHLMQLMQQQQQKLQQGTGNIFPMHLQSTATLQNMANAAAVDRHPLNTIAGRTSEEMPPGTTRWFNDASKCIAVV